MKIELDVQDTLRRWWRCLRNALNAISETIRLTCQIVFQAIAALGCLLVLLLAVDHLLDWPGLTLDPSADQPVRHTAVRAFQIEPVQRLEKHSTALKRLICERCYKAEATRSTTAKRKDAEFDDLFADFEEVER